MKLISYFIKSGIWIRYKNKWGLVLLFPNHKYCFLERCGIKKPILSFCKFRIFHLEPLHFYSNEERDYKEKINGRDIYQTTYIKSKFKNRT